jgi:uncharacterized protein YeeX (DUF496 family)
MQDLEKRVAELQQKRAQLLNNLEQYKIAISQTDGAILELSRLIESEKPTDEKAETKEEAPN